MPSQPASAKLPRSLFLGGVESPPRERARRGLPLLRARPRLQPAAPGPSELLPVGRGSLPCPRLESPRSGKSPWQRAISVAWSGSALFPTPSPQPTARSAPPLSSWDVALAAAGEPGRTARWEMVFEAARAPATPQTAPPAVSQQNGPERAQVGSEGRGEETWEGPTLARERADSVRFCPPQHLVTGS